MTVPATARRAGPYNGNGSTTSFSFSFKTFAAGDLQVTRTSSVGIETVLVLNSDYSVTLNPDQDTSPGGTITYPISGSALPTGSKLTIVGNLAYEQTTDLLGGGAFNARVIEDTFDRTVIQIQQLEERADRAMVLPVSASGVSATLPAPEANKYLGWNGGATALVNRDGSDLITAAAYGNWRTDVFNGTGAQVAFILTQDPGNVNNTDVSIGGVTQTPGVDYNVSGTTLTFTSAPPAGTGNVVVRYGLAIPAGITDSNLVTFLQAGAGVQPRSVQSKLRDMVSVKDFGAVGNGTTDDTVAIQAAINTGASLYFPAGTYRVNNLTQSTNAQRLVADGDVTISKNANGPILTSSGNSVEISGIRFVGAGYTGDNLVFTGDYVRFINCGSRDAAGRALKATGDAVQIWGSNPIWATTDATATGYDIEMGLSGTTRGYNQLYGVYTSQATGGILMTDCGVPWIIGGQFGKLNFASGTGPAGSGGLICVGARILGNVTVGLSGCTFTSNRFGVVTVTFNVGTSGHSFDQSNILSTGATIVNNGNANNLIIRETSGGSFNSIKIGADASNAVMDVFSGNGDTGQFGFRNGAWVDNNKTFAAKDSGGTLRNIAFISPGNVNFLSNDNYDTVVTSNTLLVLAAGGNGRWGVEANYLYPRADNAYSLGLGAYRPTVLYAVSGTINTSDAREKQQVRTLSDAEHRVAVRCKQLVRAFKWNDAVERKGDGARIHFGVMAQDVMAAFEAEGLDASRYGLFCYDEWDAQEEVVDAETGFVMQPARAAGNRFGVRYEQLLAFIIAAL